jgi:hypothetical protein
MSISFTKYSSYFDGDQSILRLVFTENPNEEINSNQLKETSILVFVIDKSGSMSGNAFTLLKESVNNLMPLVSESFKKIHFIMFDCQAQEVSYEDFIKASASGGTSFNNAHVKLIECLNQYDDSHSFQIIYFTDGEDNSVDFGIVSRFLINTKKSITFNTFGFGSNHDAGLLTRLTQMSLTHGFYKLFMSSKDINFDNFGDLFHGLKTGFISFENEKKKFFNLNKINEEILVLEKDIGNILSVSIANQGIEIKNSEEKNFDEITDYNFKLVIFNLYLAELFKIENKASFLNKLIDFKKFIQTTLRQYISPYNSIFENEFIEECFNEIIKSCDNLILDSKSDKEISKLKALTYDKILSDKFKKKLDERALKNQEEFEKNVQKAKQIAYDNKDVLTSMDISCFPDKCYITQENFNELLLKQDCLGICFKMSRKGEKVIVNPNFIQINDIGYSSFISLNSVFSVLKYKFDDITSEDAVLIHGGFEKNLEAFFLDGKY